MLAPLALFATAAFVSAFFPRVLPAMTNRWYSIIGAETRVAETDYTKRGPRAASFILFVGVMIWIVSRLFR
jgi:hypothetical protein